MGLGVEAAGLEYSACAIIAAYLQIRSRKPGNLHLLLLLLLLEKGAKALLRMLRALNVQVCRRLGLLLMLGLQILLRHKVRTLLALRRVKIVHILTQIPAHLHPSVDAYRIILIYLRQKLHLHLRSGRILP